MFRQDYKRRAELLGYSPAATAAPTAVTTDPGKFHGNPDATASRATALASPQNVKQALDLGLETGPGLPLGLRPAEQGRQEQNVASGGGGVGGDWSATELRGIFRGQSLTAVQSPGSVPLEERPWRHRKYYKVSL